MPKTITKSGQQEQPVGCKDSTEVVNVGPFGHAYRRKGREEKGAKRGKTR